MPMNPPTRTKLAAPTPGLRSIHYDARSTAKLQLHVAAGDVIVADDDVADQLLAASTQFKEVDPSAVPAILAAREPEPDLSSMRKAELVELAERRGVDTDGLTKAELVDALGDG